MADATRSQFTAEYHAILDALAGQGYDISAFRIPPESFSREVIGCRPAGLRSPGRLIEGDHVVVDGRLFLMRLDGVL